MLLGFAHVLAHQVTGALDDERAAQRVGDVFGQRGFAGAGRAVKAQAAVAAHGKRLHDARQLKARRDVEHGQVVSGHRVAAVGGLLLAQSHVGVFQLPLDQAFELLLLLLLQSLCIRARTQVFSGLVVSGQPGKAHCGVNLRWRQPLAGGELGHEGFADMHAVQRFSHHAFARPRRRRTQFQVVSETAAKRRVNLLDAVGHPQRRHGIGRQNLVHPGLAADGARARRRELVRARHQLRGLAGNRRKHVFNLVEQQRRLRAAFEKHLRNLQRAVAVAPAQGIAVAVAGLHLVQVQAGGLCHHLGQLGFAGAGRAVHQHIHAGRVLRHSVAQQGHQHPGVFLHKRKISQPQCAACGGPGEHRHQLAGVAVFAHQHGRQFVADLHQVGQVGDVVLGDQIFDHADALQPRASAQRFGHLGGGHPRDIGNRGVGFRRVADLELHQQRAQIALVARQRAIQQQRAFGAVEQQQVGQGINVLFNQRGLLFQHIGQPVPGRAQGLQQVFGLVLDILVEVEKQRAFFIRAAPDTMARHEVGVSQAFMAGPGVVAGAAALQKFPQTVQRRHGPHQMAARQRHQAVQVAPHIELGALARGQAQHKVRTHQIQHRGLLQVRGQHKSLRIQCAAFAHGQPLVENTFFSKKPAISASPP